jgi:UDP-glucose:(heptosyl)LPS alpha-1,3-glucosyltransferase
MKVLLVILHADSARGGAELYTVRLFHKLLEAGHDTWMAAATFEPSIDSSRRVVLEHSGLTRVGRYRRFLRSLDNHLFETDYDIVHAMLPVRSPDVYQAHAGIESVTFAATSLASQLGNRRRRLMALTEEKLLVGGTVVLCPSRRMREQIPYPRVDAEVLYSAPDDSLFVARAPRPCSKHGRGAHATFVGQDFARKGLDIAVRALAQVDGLILRVVGRDDPAKFRAMATELGVADRIEWLGARSDVADVLAESDLFLLPSRHEPFGMVVVEAMLMGVPPIVSANAGAAEVVRDGVDGRVVAGEDAALWAAAIRDVVGRRGEMSAACLSRRGELSYDNHLRQLIGIYDRVIAGRTKS